MKDTQERREIVREALILSGALRGGQSPSEQDYEEGLIVLDYMGISGLLAAEMKKLYNPKPRLVSLSHALNTYDPSLGAKTTSPVQCGDLEVSNRYVAVDLQQYPEKEAG